MTLAVEPEIAIANKIPRHERLIVIPCAISGAVGFSPFYAYNDGLSSSLSPADTGAPDLGQWRSKALPEDIRSVTFVPVLTLRQLLDAIPRSIEIEMLKTDMQGHDFAAVRSAGVALRRVKYVHHEAACGNKAAYAGAPGNDVEQEWMPHMFHVLKVFRPSFVFNNVVCVGAGETEADWFRVASYREEDDEELQALYREAEGGPSAGGSTPDVTPGGLLRTAQGRSEGGTGSVPGALTQPRTVPESAASGHARLPGVSAGAAAAARPAPRTIESTARELQAEADAKTAAGSAPQVFLHNMTLAFIPRHRHYRAPTTGSGYSVETPMAPGEAATSSDLLANAVYASGASVAGEDPAAINVLGRREVLTPPPAGSADEVAFAPQPGPHAGGLTMGHHPADPHNTFVRYPATRIVVQMKQAGGGGGASQHVFAFPAEVGTDVDVVHLMASAWGW